MSRSSTASLGTWWKLFICVWFEPASFALHPLLLKILGGTNQPLLSTKAFICSIFGFPGFSVFPPISLYPALLILESKASSHHKITCLLSLIPKQQSRILQIWKCAQQWCLNSFSHISSQQKDLCKWELLSAWTKTTFIKTLLWHFAEVVLNASLSALYDVCMISRNMRGSNSYWDSSISNKKLLYSWNTWLVFLVQTTSYEHLCCNMRNIIRLSGEDGWGAVICRK